MSILSDSNGIGSKNNTYHNHYFHQNKVLLGTVIRIQNNNNYSEKLLKQRLETDEVVSIQEK